MWFCHDCPMICPWPFSTRFPALFPYYPHVPLRVHPSFWYLCAGPLSDGRPSGLPSELLIGRCKSLSPSRDRANDHALCCLFSLWDTFRCPFRWPVLTMFNKTVKMCPCSPCSVNNCRICLSDRSQYAVPLAVSRCDFYVKIAEIYRIFNVKIADQKLRFFFVIPREC